MSLEVDKVVDRLRALCSRREYCSADIMKKALAALEGNKQQAEHVLKLLVKEGYVDDLRYASAYARDKSVISGWGAAKIRYMLKAKGLGEDVLSSALNEIDSDKAGRRLEKLMETKLRSLKDDPQCRLKMLRYAMGRGYSYDEVSYQLDILMNS
jgi:regulatory protein